MDSTQKVEKKGYGSRDVKLFDLRVGPCLEVAVDQLIGDGFGKD